MHDELKENLREVRAGLENVTGRPGFNELPHEVKERIFKAVGNLSRAIALLTFKYDEPKIVFDIVGGVVQQKITTRKEN